MKALTEVDVLTARDMEIGKYAGDRQGCGCLLWHLLNHYPGPNMPRSGPKRDLDTLLEDAARYLNGAYPTFSFNDCRGGDEVFVSRAKAARIWNLATAAAGYVVNNPEAKNVKAFLKWQGITQ